MALTAGIDDNVRRVNVLSGLLSIAVGVAIIVWPTPGIVAVAIFLGAWLIVIGTLTISGSFAVRHFMSDWWMLLITGLLEVPLGVLALADPGATLAAIITVGGIWAVAVGVMRIVMSFQLKNLPTTVDNAWAQQPGNGSSGSIKTASVRLTPAHPDAGGLGDQTRRARRNRTAAGAPGDSAYASAIARGPSGSSTGRGACRAPLGVRRHPCPDRLVRAPMEPRFRPPYGGVHAIPAAEWAGAQAKRPEVPLRRTTCSQTRALPGIR